MGDTQGPRDDHDETDEASVGTRGPRHRADDRPVDGGDAESGSEPTDGDAPLR